MKKYIPLFILVFALSELFQNSQIFATTLSMPSLSIQMETNKKILKKSIRITQSEQKRAENFAKNQAHILAYQITPSLIPVVSQTITPVLNLQSTLKISVPPQIVNPIPQVSYGILESIPGVDMNQVRNTWLSWYNTERATTGAQPLSFDSRLDKTTQDWNVVFTAGKGQNYHERTPGDGYYNFTKISQWFADRGVVGVVRNRVTTVENDGYGYYNCNSSDCTSQLIASIRSTFDYYMREKVANGDHYKSIMNGSFTKIGMSIHIEPSEKRYYLVVHYITDFQ